MRVERVAKRRTSEEIVLESIVEKECYTVVDQDKESRALQGERRRGGMEHTQPFECCFIAFQKTSWRT